MLRELAPNSGSSLLHQIHGVMLNVAGKNVLFVLILTTRISHVEKGTFPIKLTVSWCYVEHKVETKEELVSTVERLRRSPLATERVDWSRLDSRDLIQ